MNVKRDRILAALAAMALLALVFGVFAYAHVGRAARLAVAAPVSRVTPMPSSSVGVGGERAIARLGADLPAVARRHGWTAARLRATLLQDSTLRVDAGNALFYVDPGLTRTAAGSTAAAATAAGAPPAPLSDTFKLHSDPGAKLTILLDFGGRTISGTAWNASWGVTNVAAPPFSLDADTSTFSDAERTAIQDVWRRVAEDYAPYEVDVTTEFTSEAAITRSGSSDQVYGTRVLISPIHSYVGAAGGIAYLGAFNQTSDYYKPALVFPEMLGNSSKNIAEAAAHEAGHNFDLSHDGQVAHDSVARSEYYMGAGSGDTGWAPIMGAGYNENLSQWSKGEYPWANNQENDLAILNSYLPYRADDAGDTTATADVLPSGTTLSASGLISGSSDVDVYRFDAGGGLSSIAIAPEPVGPDLDVSAEIRDAAGDVLASSNPATALDANLSATLPAGRYYLFVRGTGKGDPAVASNYSSYASIGRYTVSGTVPAPTNAPVTSVSGIPSAWTSATVSFSLTATEPSSPGATLTSFYRLGAGPATTYTSPASCTTEGATTLSYWSSDAAAPPNVEATKTATIRIDRTGPAIAYSGVTTYGAPAAITVTPTDPLSGVAATTWSLDGGAAVSGATATSSVLGHHTALFTATDNAGNVSTRTVAFDVTLPTAVVATGAGFSNPIAYDLKSGLTTTFSTKVNVAGAYAVLTVATPGQGTGSTTVYDGPLVNLADQSFAFPAWNGLAGGKRLWAANYQWTLTLSKPGTTLAPSVTTGPLLISNIFVPLNGTGDGTSRTFDRYLLKGAANLYISAKSTVVSPQPIYVTVTGPPATGFSLLAASTANLSSVSPWTPGTVKLSLPAKATTDPTTWYTIGVLAQPGASYSMSIIQ